VTDLARFFRRDRHAWEIGVRLLEVRSGFARARLDVRDRHMNAVGVAQGGAIFTLADFAFAVCCNSHGTVAVAVNANVQFVRPGRKGALVAEAREVARSARLSSVRVEVTDAAGEVVALFTGLAFRREETLAAVEAARRRPRASRRGAPRGAPRATAAPAARAVSSAARRPAARGASRPRAPRG
jgi:acyl-CoA thioesterase